MEILSGRGKAGAGGGEANGGDPKGVWGAESGGFEMYRSCMGSGHILCYMFDVLMQIYQAHGVQTRDAVKSIVENNLFGLDIDDRAAQLAYFSVMMKGRQYDSRFFRRGAQMNVYAIVESNYVDKFAVEYFCNDNEKLTKAIRNIIAELNDAKEYGSILTVTKQDWETLYARYNNILDEISIYKESIQKIFTMIHVAEILEQKYHIVITNPPYMGSTSMAKTFTPLCANKLF